jgi:hypothetical protein
MDDESINQVINETPPNSIILIEGKSDKYLLNFFLRKLIYLNNIIEKKNYIFLIILKN